MHPQTLDVVRTRAETFGFDVIVDDADKVLDHQDVFGVLLQQVGTTGEVHDYSALIAELKSRKVAVKAATPDARDVQPALFVEAKQRGAHEALAKPHAFQ